MRNKDVKLINHYGKLWFFNFKRFEADNYQSLSEYYADILISEVEEHISLKDKKILDVGGARGFYCKIISKKRKCVAVNLDPDPSRYIPSFVDFIWQKTIIGIAAKLPFNDFIFDLTLCRCVLEHIPTGSQQQSVNEIFRVTKNSGICYFIIPPWYNPLSGHEFKPFHIFPFKIAKFLTQLFRMKTVNANSYAEARLFPISFKKMVEMIENSGFKIITTKDVHFRLHFLTKIPLIREFAVPSVLFILRKE